MDARSKWSASILMLTLITAWMPAWAKDEDKMLESIQEAQDACDHWASEPRSDDPEDPRTKEVLEKAEKHCEEFELLMKKGLALYPNNVELQQISQDSWLISAERNAAADRQEKEVSDRKVPMTAGKVGIRWVRISGGTFMMGSKASSGDEDTWPDRRVTVKSFEIAAAPVTFKEYGKCVDAGACTPPHLSDGTCHVYDDPSWELGRLPASFQGDDQPVVCVDWAQAKAFSEWAGGRLPSEAEWEYAARSEGKRKKYPWGDDAASCARAVMYDGALGCGRRSTWPVCSKPKSLTAQGLCDMAGNVSQWMQDWYYDSYVGAPTVGIARENPVGSKRVTRGGSWYNNANELRSTYRNSSDPEDPYGDLGFRPVKSGR